MAPVTGTVISQNVIEDEAIDVAFNTPVGQLNVHLNDFDTRGIGVDNLGTGSINATENWWGCPWGPGGKHCSTVAGPNVVFTPWLTFPFNNGNHW